MMFTLKMILAVNSWKTWVSFFIEIVNNFDCLILIEIEHDALEITKLHSKVDNTSDLMFHEIQRVEKSLQTAVSYFSLKIFQKFERQFWLQILNCSLIYLSFHHIILAYLEFGLLWQPSLTPKLGLIKILD